MKNIFNESKKRTSSAITRTFNRRLALVVGLMVCCAAFAVRAHNGWKSESPPINRPAASQPTSAAVAQATPKEPARVVKFQLFEDGIYPREVHVDKGLLAINIEDYSGGTAGLVVERETGGLPEQVGRVERSGAHWKGKSQMRLSPGQYKVYMADRPANRALLVIEP
jgi:hypothetical protein